MIHGDGLTSLQFREIAGGPTNTMEARAKAPKRIRLTRRGDEFTLSVAEDGQQFQPVGSVKVSLSNPVYVGLAVCAHDATVRESALFSRVKVE